MLAKYLGSGRRARFDLVEPALKIGLPQVGDTVLAVLVRPASQDVSVHPLGAHREMFLEVV
jgi:hypothetical protein